jgi:uncharacterized protein YfaT (DUF1175 family)
MAIKVLLKDREGLDDPIMIIEMENGDKKAFEEIKNKWNFKDEEGVLRYMMSLLLKTEDNKLWIKANGQQTGVNPADELIVKNSLTTTNE